MLFDFDCKIMNNQGKAPSVFSSNIIRFFVKPGFDEKVNAQKFVNQHTQFGKDKKKKVKVAGILGLFR